MNRSLGPVGRWGGGGQGECERRIVVIVKMKKKVGIESGSGVGGRGQDGGIRIHVIEVIVKMQKKSLGSCQGGLVRGGGGVRVDVNEESKLL